MFCIKLQYLMASFKDNIFSAPQMVWSYTTNLGRPYFYLNFQSLYFSFIALTTILIAERCAWKRFVEDRTQSQK